MKSFLLTIALCLLSIFSFCQDEAQLKKDYQAFLTGKSKSFSISTEHDIPENGYWHIGFAKWRWPFQTRWTLEIIYIDALDNILGSEKITAPWQTLDKEAKASIKHYVNINFDRASKAKWIMNYYKL